MIKKLICIFLLFNLPIFAEQRIFISSKLKGDSLRKALLEWIKENSKNYEVFDNGLIYLFFVSDNILDKKSLCFDINFYLEYDKFIVNFSNARLLDIETEETKDLKFNIWETLINGGWFKEYNDSISEITEELENIINN